MREHRCTHSTRIIFSQTLVLSYLRFHCVFTKVFTTVYCIIDVAFVQIKHREKGFQNLAVSESSE